MEEGVLMEALPPDDLRCKRTDGRDWRCKHSVVPGKTFCLSHLHRGQKRRVSSSPTPKPDPKPDTKPKLRIRIRVKPEPVDDVVLNPPNLNPDVGSLPPDNLRCNRNDGRSWRCKKWALDGLNLCEVHLKKAKAQNQRKPIMRRKKKEEKEKEEERENVVVMENVQQCGRNNGKDWRCKKKVIEGSLFCEIHVKKKPKEKKKSNVGGGDLVVGVAEDESVRCTRNDGRDWRCKKRVVEGESLCEAHLNRIRIRDSTKKNKRAKKNDDNEVVIKVEKVEEEVVVEKEKLKRGAEAMAMEEEKENVKRGAEAKEEEDERCKRTDGRGWRCKKRVMEGKTLCEIHYEQGRLRQKRITVPEELKIQRGEGVEKVEKRMKKKRELEILENNSDKGMKRMKAELIRVFLRREIMESTKKSEKRVNDSGEVTKDLPFGSMAIPPAPPAQFLDNAASLGIKIGAPHCSNPLVTRRFRSKNIEPTPISSLKVVPYPGNVEKVRSSARKKCHWCRKGDSMCIIIKCSSCRKRYFCSNCIKERSADPEEVKLRCPVCCGSCDCKTCRSAQSKIGAVKEILKEKFKRSKFQHLQYLINFLLPVLVQINQEQSIEVEKEAKFKGQNPSDVEIRQADVGCRDQCCCNNCKRPILDFHRSCPNCSYNLCLSCCREYSQGGSLGSTYPNRTKTPLPLKKCSEKSEDLASSAPLWDSTACLHISCPPMELGGCDNSLLDLRCIFPLNWTKELEISAKETVSEHNFLQYTDDSVHCSVCTSISQDGNKSKELQEASGRKESHDNFLYCPSTCDDHDCLLAHFQKHWQKGHPIKVRDVLKCVSALSWDPIAMFCGYLEHGFSTCKNLKDATEAASSSDSCDIEIGTKESFIGSIEEGYMRIRRETLKVKAKISLDFSRKLLEGFFSEIFQALPLKEYTNPRMGLLNIAGKLPEDFPGSKLGPHVCISFGSREEVARGELVTKLCFNSFDVVSILVHAGDVQCSTEQMNKIKKLIKRNSNVKDKEVQASGKDLEDETRIHSEISAEAGDQHRVAGTSCCSAATNNASTINSLRDDKSSPAKLVNSSDTDSDASMICSRPSISPDKSVDQLPRLNHLENLNITDKRPSSEPYGAQWDVFRRQDIPKLLNYITNHIDELSCSNGVLNNVAHPIFDGSFYLDAAHKMRLKEEFEIEPWTFNQCLGEAVFIPAGCPYQIKYVKSCVNIALGFISPENASECIKLINEIRVLPNNHKAKQVKLEVEKMTICSVDEAIKEIYRLKSEEGNH